MNVDFVLDFVIDGAFQHPTQLREKPSTRLRGPCLLSEELFDACQYLFKALSFRNAGNAIHSRRDGQGQQFMRRRGSALWIEADLDKAEVTSKSFQTRGVT